MGRSKRSPRGVDRFGIPQRCGNTLRNLGQDLKELPVEERVQLLIEPGFHHFEDDMLGELLAVDIDADDFGHMRADGQVPRQRSLPEMV